MRLRTVLRELRRQVAEDRVTGLAAETAFFVVLSVFPGLLVLATALGWLDLILGGDIAAEAKRTVLDFMRKLLTERASPAIDVARDLFAEKRGGVTILSLLLSIWALTRGFASVIRALNLAYDLDESRPLLAQLLVAVFLSLGSAVVGALVLAMLVSDPLFGGGRAVADFLGLGDAFATAWNYMRWLLAFALVVMWAAAIYHAAPNRSSRLGEQLPGAVVTAVLGVIASAGLNFYLTVVGSANPFLGSLGGGLILLIWLYLMSLGLLIGGELNAILASQSFEEGERDRPAAPEEREGEA